MSPVTNPLREAWSELIGDEGPSERQMKLRMVFTGPRVRAFAAAADRMPALLLEFPDDMRPPVMRPLLTRAFEVTAPDLDGLSPNRWALLIALKDPGFLDQFELLAANVVTAVQSVVTGQTAARAALRCIDRWRRFVERRAEPLSELEVRGLIGELVVLCRCAARFGATAATAAWKGPDRGLRDFELPDISVEVKTYQGDEAGLLVISSPDQLDAVPHRPLYLAAVRLTGSAEQGLTLAEFFERTAEVIGRGSPAADLLEEQAASAGYLPVHAPLYTMRFVAGPVATYAVTPGFPRIRSSEVPPGVVGVRFALRVPALAPFQTAAADVIGDCVVGVEAC
jgi:hypothetical protein